MKIFKKKISYSNLRLLTLSCLLFFSFYSNSQDFSYSSDKFFSDEENNSLIFEGNVNLNYDDFIFNADLAELNQSTKNLELNSLTFKVKDQFVWGESEKASASKGKISFEKAKFSLCPCEEKIWWIEADKVDLDTEKNNISFEKGKLKVNDKAIFFFPKGSFPASGNRRSGFLLPEISASNKSGTDISIPYYFNLAKNYDLSIEPRYISKRGEGGSSEFRYLSNNYSGTFKTSFLSEDDEYSNINNSDLFRWSVNFTHNAKFLNGYFLQVNYSNLSDSLFLRDFGGGFNGQSDQLFVPQKIEIYNFGSNYEFSANINAFKLTSPIGINQFQEVPELKLDYFFDYKNFDLSLKTNYQQFRKGGSFFENSKQRIERIKIEPEVLFHKKTSSLNSMIKINYTLENFFFENTNKSRYAPKAEFKLSQTLFKNNENKSELLTPFIKFIYAKNTNQENLPNINSGFFLDSKALSNKIISGDSFKPMRRDILIGSDYFFFKNRSKLNLSISKLYGLGNRFLKTSSYILNLPEPIQMKLSYKNGQNLNLYGALTKDTNDNYDYFSAGISKKFLNENYSSFNFIWIRDINSYIFENDEVRKIQFIENKNKFHINERTSFYTKVDYDLKNSNLSNLVLGIEYENPGLIFGIALIESNELDWFKLINENSFNEYNQESFRIYFELKGLGSLGRKINQYTEKNSIQ